ncbi:hypothetical protein [Vreelandella olivaria]|uniref:hypothetical protein n=1 Tax=Vreelandella olivaria TaxID=390919 RepID=UPI00201F57AA|nr:hypothetical protein [Halomonas olivaria]
MYERERMVANLSYTPGSDSVGAFTWQRRGDTLVNSLGAMPAPAADRWVRHHIGGGKDNGGTLVSSSLCLEHGLGKPWLRRQ